MNENVKVVCDVKDKVLDILRKANKSPEFSMGDVDFLYKATKTIKNSCEIEQMMEDEGGYSSANRGQHYVRGHYSRDDGGSGGYSSRRGGSGRGGRGGYSRDGGYSRSEGTEEMMEYVRMAIESAPDEYREDLKRFMRELEND